MSHSQNRLENVSRNPEKAVELLETIAVLCGNHNRRDQDPADPMSYVSLGYAVLRIEGRIRELLTGDSECEISGN